MITDAVKNCYKKLQKLIKNNRASPMVEEGVLIGIGLFGLLLILSVVTGVLDWFINLGDELIRELSSI